MADAEILELLAEEAELENAELAPFIAAFDGGAESARPLAEGLERLSESGTALGLRPVPGLVFWLQDNLMACAESEPLAPERCQRLLGCWLGPLIDLCRDPADAAAVQALAQALKAEEWPLPIPDTVYAVVFGMFGISPPPQVTAAAEPEPEDAEQEPTAAAAEWPRFEALDSPPETAADAPLEALDFDPQSEPAAPARPPLDLESGIDPEEPLDFAGASTEETPFEPEPEPEPETEPEAPDAPAPVNLLPDPDLDERLWDAFLSESPLQAVELAELIRGCQGQVRQDQAQAAERLAHSIKGAGNLAGIPLVAQLAEALEDALELLTEQPADAALSGLLCEAADVLECQFTYIGEAEAPGSADSAELTAALTAWRKAHAPGAEYPQPAAPDADPAWAFEVSPPDLDPTHEPTAEAAPGFAPPPAPAIAAWDAEAAGLDDPPPEPDLDHGAPLQIDPAADPRLVEAFSAETPDQAAQLAALLQRAASGELGPEQAYETQRLAHTIKGSCALLGLDAVEALAHRLEDVLELLDREPPPADLGVLFIEVGDALEALFDALLAGREQADIDPAELQSRLGQWAARLMERDNALDTGVALVAAPIPPEAALGTDLNLAGDIDPRLLDAFFAETPDLVAQLAEQLRSAAAGGLIGPRVYEAQRLAHTVKGSCALVGLEAIESLAHRLEDVLERLGDQAPDPELGALFVEAGDTLEALFDRVLERATHADIETAQLMQRLGQWAGRLGEAQGLGESAVGADGESEETPLSPQELLWDENAPPEKLDAFFQEVPDQGEALAALLSGGAIKDPEARGQAEGLAGVLTAASQEVGIRVLRQFTDNLRQILHGADRGLSKAGLDALEEGAELLRDLLAAIQGIEEPKPDLRERLNFFTVWARRVVADEPEGPQPQVPQPAPAAAPAPDTPQAPSPPAGPEPEPEAAWPVAPTVEHAAAAPVAASLRVPTKRIDNLMRLVGEMTTAVAQLQGRMLSLQEKISVLYSQGLLTSQRLGDLQTLVEVQNVPAATPANAEAGAGFDPLEMDQYHELHGITSALIESFNDSQQMARLSEEELNQLTALVHHQERLSQEVNEAVLATRMMPLNVLTPRLERTVREACRASGKRAQLLVEGDALLADTDIVNGLRDPLMHLLRNSVDHGLEAPGERAAKGKPESGVVHILFRRQGNTIQMRIWDDGAGFDLPKIRAKAERLGVARVGELTEAELLRLVLQPGFSTKQQTTKLSGRGIGMDVVRQAVEELKGSLILANRTDGGAEITLRLPLTLVSAPVLLVQAREQIVALPSDDVDQLLFPEPGSLVRMASGWSFKHGGKFHPLHALNALLGLEPRDQALENHATGPVVLVHDELGHQAVALQLARERRDVVVQPLGPWLPKVRGVSGACILADGSVAPLLELRALLRSDDLGERLKIPLSGSDDTAATEDAAEPPAQQTVLVVDDSFSARQALVIAMEQKGFKTATAIDGLDAIRVLDEVAPQLLLVDMEMPRMNGLELTRHVRAQPETESLPVVMVTSRSTAKHRQSAEQAGVSAYVTKPFDNDALFQLVARLIADHSGARG